MRNKTKVKKLLIKQNNKPLDFIANNTSSQGPGGPLTKFGKLETVTTKNKQESLNLYFEYQQQTKAPVYTTYSKLDELSLITVGLASASRIRQWAEKTLPNGNVVGEVTNANTLHYKTLKPVKGGLFCERVFGPLKDFECACSSKIGKKILKYKKAQKNTPELDSGDKEGFINSQGTLDKILDNKVLIQNTYGPSGQPGLIKNYKRFFCPECDVEYTWSVMRRYQLGYIKLNAPVTHLWYVKGNPSYISLLLDMKRKDVENIAYCNQNLTLENALKFSPETFSTLTDFAAENRPSELYAAWEKVATPFLKSETSVEGQDGPTAHLKNNLPTETALSAALGDQIKSSSLPGSSEKNKKYKNVYYFKDLYIGTGFEGQDKPQKPYNIITKKSSKEFKSNLAPIGTTKKEGIFKSSLNSLLPIKGLNTSIRLPTIGSPKTQSKDASFQLGAFEEGKQQIVKIESKAVELNTIAPERLHIDGLSYYKLYFMNQMEKTKTLKTDRRSVLANKDTSSEKLVTKLLSSSRINQIEISQGQFGQITRKLYEKLSRIGKDKQNSSTLKNILDSSEKFHMYSLGVQSVFMLSTDSEIGLRLIKLLSTAWAQSRNFNNRVTNDKIRTNKILKTLFNDPLKENINTFSTQDGLKVRLKDVLKNQPRPVAANSFIFNYLLEILGLIKLNEQALRLEKNISYTKNALPSLMSSIRGTEKTAGPSLGTPLPYSEADVNIILAAICTANLKSQNNEGVRGSSIKGTVLQNLNKNVITQSFIFQKLNILKYLILANLQKNKHLELNNSMPKDNWKFPEASKFIEQEPILRKPIAQLLKRIIFLNRFLKIMSTVLPTLNLEIRVAGDPLTQTNLNNNRVADSLLFQDKGKNGSASNSFANLLLQPELLTETWNPKSQNKKMKLIYGPLRYAGGVPGSGAKLADKKQNKFMTRVTSLMEVILDGPTVRLNEQSLFKTGRRPVLILKSLTRKPTPFESTKSELLSQNRWSKTPSTKNIVVNNIYCLSHRFLWEQEKDWYFFALYYYGFSNNLLYLQSSSFHLDDIAIPVYAYRNYDFSFLNTLFSTSSTVENNNSLKVPIAQASDQTPKQNLHVAYSGAGMLKTLLEEFDFTELKKMDKQNRILLYDLNKYIRKVKKRLYGSTSQGQTMSNIANSSEKLNLDSTELNLTFKLNPISSSTSTGTGTSQDKKLFKDLCKQRDIIIRKTKLIRKVFINSLASGNYVEERSRSAKGVQTKNFSFNSGGAGIGSNMSNQLSSMILTTLPVLPPDLRPIVKMGTQIAASDLNRLYQRVIYRNDRLKRFLKDSITNGSYEMKYAQRLLQEAVDNLIQNGKSGVVPEKDARGRALKSLSEILKGKQGRFRQYLLGKRVDYSGRSVIVVGPKLKLHECGIPKEMALELFLPFLIKRILTDNLARTVIGAKSLIKTNKPLVWGLLREILKTNPVLLNRAPTLHRLGFQAFQPKLVDGRAILLHPLVCPAFNADFDGDQMAVHVPISAEARAEAWKLMLSRNNLLSPATGEPLVLPSQDMVLGCYYLTTNSNIRTQIYEKGYGLYFDSIADVLRAYNLGMINIHAIIWLKWNPPQKIETSTYVESPIEIRINEFGLSTVIYQKSYTTYKYVSAPEHPMGPGNNIMNTVIRTTAGKILFNTIIQQSLLCK